MIPPAFDYHRADSVEGALDLLADRDGQVRLLAGGHGLVPDLKAGEVDADALVDVSGLAELTGVERTDDGGLTVGALTTHADLLASETARERAPVLGHCERDLGDRQVRNRGTIGGNLAEADPAADLPAAALAAEATVQVRGPDGARSVEVADLVNGDGNGLADDELLTRLEVPGSALAAGTAESAPGAAPASATGSAYLKRAHPASGYALSGVAAVVGVADGRVTDARVAATGATAGQTRLGAAEAAAVGTSVDDDDGLADAGTAVDLDGLALRGDHHASASFRGNLLSVQVGRALVRAVGRATGEGAGEPGATPGRGAADGGGR